MQDKTQPGRSEKMRGYYSTTGFWGLVNGSYRLFASEEDYYDSMTDEE